MHFEQGGGKWSPCGLQRQPIGRVRFLVPSNLRAETSCPSSPSPSPAAFPAIARRNGQERYAAPHTFCDAYIRELWPRTVLAAVLTGCANKTSTPGTALTNDHSEVSYHHGAPHLDGHDRLLPHNATATCASAAEHAQIRSYRYASPLRPFEGNSKSDVRASTLLDTSNIRGHEN